MAFGAAQRGCQLSQRPVPHAFPRPRLGLVSSPAEQLLFLQVEKRDELLTTE